MDASDSSKTTLTTTRSIKEIITLKTNWTMKRNTLFTVMMCCMMAVVSNSIMAQGRGNHGEGRYDRNEGPGYSFSMRGNDKSARRGRNDRYDTPRHNPHDDMYGRGHHDEPRHKVHGKKHHRDEYRVMHGHRWDCDGWMEGYHGRVRHFHDGRWGYLRDGRWYYYDCFYEPAFYYSRPVAHFHSHCLTPRERRIAGAIVGTAAVATLISALVH